MRRLSKEDLLLGSLILAMAGVAPNIFPAAQAGLAKMSWLGLHVLLPASGLLMVLIAVAAVRGRDRLVRRALAGAAAGAVATLGLEVIRIASFQLGGMPGDLPRLMGVLMIDRFMLGPSTLSDLIGYAYHFWNGASFGLVFTVLAGHRPPVWSVLYGLLLGLGFLVSPAVQSMGVGFMGLAMPSMVVTVLLAHLAYGILLGKLIRHLLKEPA